MKVGMILRRPPYGDINAAEAVRHALGAVSDDLGVSLLLLDGGALLALKGQDEGQTEYTNLGAVLKDCIEMGVEVFADEGFLKGCNIAAADLVEGVKPADSKMISARLRASDKIMIF
ncbi:MAG: DsrE family protein [Nitrospiraceae bacterium]|nr:DsrE family protein [Nitrospiraceae bacterium]